MGNGLCCEGTAEARECRVCPPQTFPLTLSNAGGPKHGKGWGMDTDTSVVVLFLLALCWVAFIADQKSRTR